MRISDPGQPEAARGFLGLSIFELWTDYVALGGILPPSELGTFLAHEGEISGQEYDLLVHALNEHLAEHDLDHPLAYSEDL